MPLRIDHILIGVDDLEGAGEQLYERYGLASLPGGRHPGRGTENRTVPFGDQYLELVSVVDEDEARSDPFGRLVWHLLTGERRLAWCVEVDDIDAVAGRLGVEPEWGGRVRPDGSALRWRMAGLEEVLAEPFLPFFISWEVAFELHPGRACANHCVFSRGVAWVEVAGDEEVLRHWLGEELPVRFADGPPGVNGIAIATDAGEVVLRNL